MNRWCELMPRPGRHSPQIAVNSLRDANEPYSHGCGHRLWHYAADKSEHDPTPNVTLMGKMGK
ncbi:hypothetical protein E2C01_072270 [Portunus trituberculatus]|uniref:Uncharacterized protein n=1 Tax=Portunus trituberculatus TaxID=210409 RepID=A0A5B7I695_PORTR|nr:hypothetical protein [Portunus trituberculatus]